MFIEDGGTPPKPPGRGALRSSALPRRYAFAAGLSGVGDAAGIARLLPLEPLPAVGVSDMPACWRNIVIMSIGIGKTTVLLLLGGDLGQRLQVAQLERRRFGGHDGAGLCQAAGGLVLTLGVDDLGAAFALGLGLAAHRVDHVGRQRDVSHLDDRHLDAPRLGRLVDDVLQALVHVVALAQQLVEVGLAEDAAQRGLRDERRRADVVGDLDDGHLGVEDAEVDDGVHLHRHVVPGDDVLAGHVHRHHAQVDLHHAVHERQDEEQPRPAGAHQTAQAEDHAALVFLDDLDRQEEQRERPDVGRGR